MKLLAALVFSGLLNAQEFPNVTVETVIKDAHFAAGPAWSLDGFLLYSDTPLDRIEKWNPGKGETEYATRSGGAAGNAIDSDGRLYTCEFRERRVTRTAKNGKIDVLAAKFEGKRLNAPNAIVVRRDGNVYFTDPAFGNQQDSRELDFYGVYRIKTNGELEAVARWKTRPGGLALSPNGRLLYVSDADERSIKVFDLAGGGAASNERVFASKIDGAPAGIDGAPAGLVTDAKGNVFVAANKLLVFSPKGEVLREIQLAQTPSDMAFGDKDFLSLYVTARTAVYRIRATGLSSGQVLKGSPQNAPQVP